MIEITWVKSLHSGDADLSMPDKSRSNSSMLECLPVTQAARVRFPAEPCLSRGALVEDGDDLGQVSSYYQYCGSRASFGKGTDIVLRSRVAGSHSLRSGSSN